MIINCTYDTIQCISIETNRQLVLCGGDAIVVVGSCAFFSVVPLA